MLVCHDIAPKIKPGRWQSQRGIIFFFSDQNCLTSDKPRIKYVLNQSHFMLRQTLSKLQVQGTKWHPQTLEWWFKMCNYSPIRWGLLTSRSFFRWHPNLRGGSLTADPLLWGGDWLKWSLHWVSIYTLVESDLWSYMVSSLETSLNKGV